jgi:hypothetical protein
VLTCSLSFFPHLAIPPPFLSFLSFQLLTKDMFEFNFILSDHHNNLIIINQSQDHFSIHLSQFSSLNWAQFWSIFLLANIFYIYVLEYEGIIKQFKILSWYEWWEWFID